MAFKKAIGSWFARSALSVSAVARRAQVAFRTLDAALKEGQLLDHENLQRVALVLFVPTEEWRQFDTGQRLIMPDDNPLWEQINIEVRSLPLDDDALEKWEEFLEAMRRSLKRLAA